MVHLIGNLWIILWKKFKRESENNRSLEDSLITTNKIIEEKNTNSKLFKVGDLFIIERGSLTNLNEMEHGDVPIVSAYGANQGITFFGNVEPKYEKMLTASMNGSGTGYIAYHDYKFNINTDCAVLIPKTFTMNKYIGLYISTVMNKIAVKYTYGRKLTKNRLENEEILLPICDDDKLDLSTMENYIRSLPFADRI